MTNIYYGKDDEYDDGGWYGNDYHFEDKLPLLNKFLEGMPTDLSVADNGELLCFMYSDMSISIRKDIFDFSEGCINDAYKWSAFYEALFKNRINMPHNSWINIKYVFFNAMHNLPNYKLAVFADKMCKFIRKRNDVQNAIAQKIITKLLSKSFNKVRVKSSHLNKESFINLLKNNKEQLIDKDTILVDFAILLYKNKILNDELVNEAYELDEYEFSKDKEELVKENELFERHLLKLIYDATELISSDKYIYKFIAKSYIYILDNGQSKRSNAFDYFINNVVLANLYNSIDPIDVDIKIKDNDDNKPKNKDENEKQMTLSELIESNK